MIPFERSSCPAYQQHQAGAPSPILDSKQSQPGLRYLPFALKPVRRCWHGAGLDLGAEKIASLLSKMQLSAQPAEGGKAVRVEVPITRSDVLHGEWPRTAAHSIGGPVQASERSTWGRSCFV